MMDKQLDYTKLTNFQIDNLMHGIINNIHAVIVPLDDGTVCWVIDGVKTICSELDRHKGLPKYHESKDVSLDTIMINRIDILFRDSLGKPCAVKGDIMHSDSDINRAVLLTYLELKGVLQ